MTSVKTTVLVGWPVSRELRKISRHYAVMLSLPLFFKIMSANFKVIIHLLVFTRTAGPLETSDKSCWLKIEQRSSASSHTEPVISHTDRTNLHRKRQHSLLAFCQASCHYY